jgi:TRAP-type C4-dicarboxylate transport system substrate-binding protein
MTVKPLSYAIAWLIAAFAAGMGPAAAQVEGPQVSWRIATMGSARAATTHIETIKKHVEAETDGRFSITIGYGTFGDSREFLDLLKIGAIHGATVQASVSVERLPLYTALDLPFLPIGDAAEQRRIHDAVHEHPAIIAEFAAWGAFPFMSSLLPSYELMGGGTKPASLADLDGMRIRALGGNGNALAKLGVVPANMPPQEMYVALDRGLIGAVALPYYAHVSYRTYELGSWMTTNMGLAGTALPVALSKQAWDELPEQYRALLLEARKVAYAAQIEAMDVEGKAALETIQASGMEMMEFGEDELGELRRVGAEPVWDEWRQANTSNPQADAVLDFILETAAD